MRQHTLPLTSTLLPPRKITFAGPSKLSNDNWAIAVQHMHRYSARTSAFGAPPWSSAFGLYISIWWGHPTLNRRLLRYIVIECISICSSCYLNHLSIRLLNLALDCPRLAKTGLGGGSTTTVAPATTAPQLVFDQPTFVPSAFGTSAQPPGGSSFIKPVSGFGACASGGTSAFGTSGTSTTTNPRPSAREEMQSRRYRALTRPLAAVASNTPAREVLCGQSEFRQTNPLAALTTTAFGASTQLQEGVNPAFANLGTTTTPTPLASLLRQQRHLCLVNPLNRRPHSQDALSIGTGYLS
ncbi:hypothetical protein BKA70DRAFT_1509813 [Coprinopsis sp. MPI-PUGE-AT-0042]|nr:hypothetical protein BKA70DRAFT_1509813 [Coprinopsis sp. MPI-PUGE-AT-0042]